MNPPRVPRAEFARDFLSPRPTTHNKTAHLPRPRSQVLRRAAGFRPVVKALLVDDHLPNNIAARSGHLVHYLKDLGEGEGEYAQETDAPCGRGSTSDPEVPNDHCPPRRSSRPPRRATEHDGGRCGHPRGRQVAILSTAGVLVIRLPVSIHLVLSLTCRCAAHLCPLASHSMPRW